MLIGVVRVEMFLPESSSLKSKRAVVKSLKARLRNKFNVSVAEIEHQEKWQRLLLGMAMVTNERKFIDQNVSGIIKLIESDGRAEIIKHSVELL